MGDIYILYEIRSTGNRLLLINILSKKERLQEIDRQCFQRQFGYLEFRVLTFIGNHLILSEKPEITTGHPQFQRFWLTKLSRHQFIIQSTNKFPAG